jgi:hypothetical protein
LAYAPAGLRVPSGFLQDSTSSKPNQQSNHQPKKSHIYQRTSIPNQPLGLFRCIPYIVLSCPACFAVLLCVSAVVALPMLPASPVSAYLPTRSFLPSSCLPRTLPIPCSSHVLASPLSCISLVLPFGSAGRAGMTGQQRACSPRVSPQITTQSLDKYIRNV